MHAPPPKLSKAAPDLPAALEPVLAKALSKSALDRYSTCGEFIALARAAAVPEPRVSRARLAISFGLLALAALAGAAIAIAVDRLAFGSARPAPLAKTLTVLATPPAGPPSLDRLLLKSKDGRTLNDAAFALITAGEYSRALPFARKAMRDAKQGTLTRGYATFNVGYALLNLGKCRDALPFLLRSLKIEPPANQVYIQERITAAKSCVQGGASVQPQFRSSGAGSDPSRGP
jgi:tetratricopeptide (TPR) repeat protein